ncbi:MAG: helix-turn-helix domain-containing protein [Parvularculaceae bacterium]
MSRCALTNCNAAWERSPIARYPGLKEMEADGLVHRRDYGEIPPRVDYSLTGKGRNSGPVLKALEEWALIKP